MYAFAIIVVSLSVIFASFALVFMFVCIFDWRVNGFALAVIILGLTVCGAIWGFSTIQNIERTQCEQAGFEWIAGKCYGVNVNVNR